jgi:hypothetical protein
MRILNNQINFSSMSTNETAMQNTRALQENLLDEISVCEPSGVLAGETSARVPERRTGN